MDSEGGEGEGPPHALQGGPSSATVLHWGWAHLVFGLEWVAPGPLWLEGGEAKLSAAWIPRDGLFCGARQEGLAALFWTQGPYFRAGS